MSISLVESQEKVSDMEKNNNLETVKLLLKLEIDSDNTDMTNFDVKVQSYLFDESLIHKKARKNMSALLLYKNYKWWLLSLYLSFSQENIDFTRIAEDLHISPINSLCNPTLCSSIMRDHWENFIRVSKEIEAKSFKSSEECGFCREKSKYLNKCNKCKKVWFCSRTCEKAAEPFHIYDCERH